MNKNEYLRYHIFFKKLSNPLRTKIITSLRVSSKSVTQLYKDLNTEQSKISHALNSLKRCSIVTAKRKGKNIIYSLNKQTIIPMLNLIKKHEKKFCKYCKEK
jgi:DNA-binding transcriptional ArsR family regulator